MPDDDAPEGPEPPTTALRELFRIERLTGVPVSPMPVLVGPVDGGALRAALLSIGREPVLLAIEPPKAPEPEAPIDVAIDLPPPAPALRAVSWQDHSPMCRLLDAPARKRGWPFTCICGGSRR